MKKTNWLLSSLTTLALALFALHLARAEITPDEADLVDYHWSKLTEAERLFEILKPLRAGNTTQAIQRLESYLESTLLDAARHRNLPALTNFVSASDVLHIVKPQEIKDDRIRFPRHSCCPLDDAENDKEINELLDKLIEQGW